MLLTVIIIVYLFVIAYLGYLGYRRTSSTKDYLVAGRTINPYVMAMSYGATFISTSAIVGFGGVAGLFGMGLLWLTVLTIFVGIFIAFLVYGKRTRKMGHNINAHTFPELLGRRYDSKLIQKLSGIVIFLAMPLYAAVVLIGGSRFIEQTLNVNFEAALLVFSVIIAAYVIAGGLKGVMYTDALQGSIMFVSMVFLIGLTYYKLGGITEAHAKLTAMAQLVPPPLQKIGHSGWTAMPAVGSGWWWELVSTLVMGVGIGVLAQPQLVVRFMTVRSNRELNRAILIGGIFILACTGGAFVVGSLTNAYFYENQGVIAIAAAKGNFDNIIPLYINEALPGWFVYLFMITLLSAAMSTLSSQFHAMGTAIGHDVYATFKKNSEKDRTILISKLGILFAICLSVVIGYTLPQGIIARGTAVFFGICAATFLPAYTAAIYWKKATKEAALASIITGFSTSLLYLLFFHKKNAAGLGLCRFIFGKDFLIETMPWPIIDPMVISLPISAVVLVVVTYLTFKPGHNSSHLSSCFKDIT
jgi:SSS family solute:Na+ symporter